MDALRTDGLVLLNDVVDPAHLDVLHERMTADLDAYGPAADAPYNWNAGNLQQDPPPFPPYLFPDVPLNRFVITVTASVLGPGLKNVMYSGNTALPSDLRQPVHPDVGHLWPLRPASHPTRRPLVVNVPMVDISPENGARKSGRGPTATSPVPWRHQDHARAARPAPADRTAVPADVPAAAW